MDNYTSPGALRQDAAEAIRCAVREIRCDFVADTMIQTSMERLLNALEVLATALEAE